jgi:Uma2 family endonuclease
VICTLNVVIEFTSVNTQEEDIDQKLWVYRDRLEIPEYFLFALFAEYLDPPLRGYRLKKANYTPIGCPRQPIRPLLNGMKPPPNLHGPRPRLSG